MGNRAEVGVLAQRQQANPWTRAPSECPPARGVFSGSPTFRVGEIEANHRLLAKSSSHSEGGRIRGGTRALEFLCLEKPWRQFEETRMVEGLAQVHQGDGFETIRCGLRPHLPTRNVRGASFQRYRHQGFKSTLEGRAAQRLPRGRGRDGNHRESGGRRGDR